MLKIKMINWKSRKGESEGVADSKQIDGWCRLPFEKAFLIVKPVASIFFLIL